jgi:hypothetical protein
MDSLSANDDLPPSASTTADEIEHNVSVRDNRMTRVNFGDGLELDDNDRVLTLGERVTPGSASPTSKKRKAVTWQDDRYRQGPDVEASLKTATMPGLRDLQVVKAAQGSGSVLDLTI